MIKNLNGRAKIILKRQRNFSTNFPNKGAGMRIVSLVAFIAAVSLPMSGFAQKDTTGAVSTKQKRTAKTGKTTNKLLKGKFAPGSSSDQPSSGQSTTGSSGTQTPAQTPAQTVKYIELQMGSEYITSTGYHLVLKNTSANNVENAILFCAKGKDGNMTGSAPAGSQVVAIPANDTIQVQVTHPAGWCVGYSTFQATVTLDNAIIGQRSWSIPLSAQQ
jgi:hypothetical protein